MELRHLSGTDCGIAWLRGNLQSRKGFQVQFGGIAYRLLSGAVGHDAAEQIAAIACAGFDFKIGSQSTREFRAVQACPGTAFILAHLPLIAQVLAACFNMEVCFLTGIHGSVARLGGDFHSRFRGELCTGAGEFILVLIRDDTVEQIAVKVCAGFDFKVRSQSTREFGAAHVRPVETVVSA